MKYYLIAGEASGDLHGALLIEAIKKNDAHAEFRFCGGENMERVAGKPPFIHSKLLTVMGFWEVLKRIRTIKKQLKMVKKDLKSFQPDRLILIDFPGFNLRMAAFGKQNHIPVHYYISPKVWAWNTSRALKIKRTVDELYSILPFEPAFYERFDFRVNYVGNPLVDAVNEYELDDDWLREQKQKDKAVIALLPGSRYQEIDRMLPSMIEAAGFYKDYRIMLAAAPGFEDDFYAPYLNQNVELVRGHTYELLGMAKAALVTSGTATLEAALLHCPQVVCYKTSSLSYALGKRLIRVPYISLVNLIADREVVKELIQDKMNPHYLMRELNHLLKDRLYREDMLKGYEEVSEALGAPGAPQRAAEIIARK